MRSLRISSGVFLYPFKRSSVEPSLKLKKNEYYAFSRKKTIPVEIFIPHTDIKKINKRDQLF